MGSDYLFIYSGEDKTFLITVIDSAGNPTDLTPYTALEFEVKPQAGDPDPALISKTLGSGLTLLAQTGDTLGQAHLKISSVDTVGQSGTFECDLIGVDGAGDRQVLMPPSPFVIFNVVNQA